jgi:hypothetical protein
LLTAIIIAIAALSLAAFGFRERLRWLAATRQRRVLVSAVLLVIEAVVALILSSIEFGGAVKGEAFTTQDAPLLPWLVVLTGTGAGMQTMVLLHDDFAETERAAFEKEAQLARRDRAFVSLLGNMINRAVARKREKFNAIQPTELLSALDPKPAIAALVQASWHVFDKMGPEQRVSNFRLRVAYYRAEGAGLSLAHAWNGTDQDCVQLSDEARKRFRFNHHEGCLAVAASKNGSIYQVADTMEAHQDRQHPFWFFETAEHDTLKSIAALPIKLDGTKQPYSVLIVDTNQKAFFNASDQRQALELEQVVVNLAQRLQLEERLGYLLGGRA